MKGGMMVMMPTWKSSGTNIISGAGGGKGGAAWGAPAGGAGWGKKAKAAAAWGAEEDWGPAKKKAKPSKNANWITGLDEEVHKALEPVIMQETEWTPEDTERKMKEYIAKTANSFAQDERRSQTGSAMQAKGIIQEFVQSAMSSISQACYEKPWVNDVDFSGPIYTAAFATVQDWKLFNRTLAPMMKKYVDEELFKWAEEARVDKVIAEAIEASPVPEAYHKKAKLHLMNAYGRAHLMAPYGTSTQANPQMGLLEDFMLGWIQDFISRAWDILSSGIGEDEEAQKAFINGLFVYLAGPDVACIPSDLVAELDSMPPLDWPFIYEATNQIFAENAAAAMEPKGKNKNRVKQEDATKWL